MPDLDPRRRFNQRERTALYLAADGRCADCGAPLPPDWHADHTHPHSLGGPTDIANAKAKCPTCNRKKGASLNYTDTFQHRPFQRAVEDAVLDGISAGRRVTTVEASPGSGKTLAYQETLTALWRLNLIDYAAVFVPRLILARQCETSWMHRARDEATQGEKWSGNHTLFDPARRFGMIQHIPNRPPLTPHGTVGVGFVQTYTSLVTDPAIYESWAKQHRGRFLLVADEAQFCGAGDEKTGTRAGAWIEEMSKHAAHTLLLTGTPYRADGAPLVLADYTEPDESGTRRLVSHAAATYADGVAEGYLRPFEAQMTEARAKRRYLDNMVLEYDMSRDGSDLRDILREARMWQPLAVKVVESLREKQRTNRQYKALISCMEQREARAVRSFLVGKYPDLTVQIAVSDDGPEAETALREFQMPGGGDVMVTVRKAFIGYDCPEITVVGVLTHYRDWGHLMQLVGRGLRQWKGATGDQTCRVVAPDDPKMAEFIDFMRGQSEQGLKDRAKRESDAARLPGTPEQVEQLYVLEEAYATTTRGVSNDVELGAHDWELVEAIKREVGSVDDVTTLAKAIELAGIRFRNMRPAEPDPVEQLAVPVSGGPPLTERERIDKIQGQAAAQIRSNLAARGIVPTAPGYSDYVARETAAVNDRAGLKAGAVRSVDGALARLRAARSLGQDLSRSDLA